jgi:hypothetical protein
MVIFGFPTNALVSRTPESQGVTTALSTGHPRAGGATMMLTARPRLWNVRESADKLRDGPK